LSGAPGTIDTVNSLIDRSQLSWRTGGPMRNFGVWDEATGALAGNCEANAVAESIGPTEVNVSYAIWPRFRGRGYAARAVELLCGYLADDTGVDTAIIRVEPANTRSLAVARRAGFVEIPSSEPKFLRLARPLR
jgi:RimJ/RimL family protein N-acetyltransferase